MKIMQINCVYNTGSTGKLMCSIHENLIQNGIESVICYGRGNKVKDKGVYKTCSDIYAKANNLLSRITGLMYGGCFFSTNKLIKVIESEHPDIIHIQCINGYFVNIYKLINWLKIKGIATVITLHAEFMYTANCSHSYECLKWKNGCGNCPVLKSATRSLILDRTAESFKLMKNAFNSFDNMIVVSVSGWLMNRAIQSPILSDKRHRIIWNGVNTNIFKYRKNIEKQHKDRKEKIILHVTPYFTNQLGDLKGGRWILKLAKATEKFGYKIIIVGENRVKDDVPSNVIFLGRIMDQTKLSEIYSSADVTVLTSKRETFSMVVAESLCCGTQVVGFKSGGPEEIGIDEYSAFVEYGDLDNLINEIIKKINNPVSREDVQLAAHKIYSSEVMVDKYMEIYKELYKN